MTTEERVSGLDLRNIANLEDTLNTDEFMFYESYVPIQHGTDPMKAISIRDLYYGTHDSTTILEVRKLCYRARNLGPAVTDEQWEEIRKGTFRNMFLGDYWYANNLYWVISDFDYFYEVGDGDNKVNYHHVTIMPSGGSAISYDDKMNDTDSNTGGYLSSKMKTQTFPNKIEPLVHAVFGKDHIATVRRLFSNSVDSDGNVLGTVWADSTIDLPDIGMIFGTFPPNIIATTMSGTSIAKQLALLQHYPRRMYQSYVGSWLSDMVGKGFYVTSGSGPYVTKMASNTGQIAARPVFSIRG